MGFGFSWGGTSITTEQSDLLTTPPTEPTKTELNWPDECKGGPSYWCQNLISGKECNAITHCTQTVWMHSSSSNVDDSSVCKTCIDYVTAVKEATSSNSTEKEVRFVLETLCQLVPYEIVTKECELAVREFLPELQDLIKEWDPVSFCKAIFICDAFNANKAYFKAKSIMIPEIESKPSHKIEETTELIPTSTVQPKKKLECKNCYTLITTGQKMFKRASRDDVLNRMLEICGELSSFSDICSVNVISHFPTIYHHLETLNVDDACHLSGACDELYHFHEITTDLKAAIDAAPENTNDEVCDFCLAMVNHLRDIVIANSTELEFKQVLLGICKQTGSFEDQCKQLVNQYYELIYQFMVNELDAKEVCQEVKLCVPKGISVDIKSEFPLWPVVPSSIDIDEVLKNETSPSLIETIHLSQSSTNFTKPMVLVGANKCTWGPGYWCMNMTTSKKCPGTLDHCIHKVWENMELPADNGDICNICKDMVKQARDQLNSNETQEELREVFEGSCKLIPIKIARKECIKAVDEFVPELVETLSSQMNPQIVCATVGLCNSARMDSLLLQEKLAQSTKVKEIEFMAPLPIDRMFPKIVADTEFDEQVKERGKEACEICELLLHFVQQQMTLPKSETEIKNIVNNVCVELPHNVATQCSSFIEVYGDAFISLLAQEIDPSVVCPKIGACSSLFGHIDNVKPTCPLCLLALEALENKIGNNKTVENIEKGLDHLCKDLPHDMIGECERLVKKSTDEIVDSLMADFSPQETCLYLKFCDASVAKTDDSVAVDTHGLPVFMPQIEIDDVATNEIHVPKDEEKADNKCVLCEFIMSKLDTELKDKKTAEEIKKAVYGICNHMPAAVRNDCDKFVNQYADLVIDLLAASLEPKQVCTQIHMCKPSPTKLESNLFKVATSQQSQQSNKKEQERQLFIIYMCVGGFVCMILVLLAIIKTRKAFSQNNSPYTRVTY